MIGFFRFLFFLLIVAALAYWLADRPGDARIVWHGMAIQTSAAFLAVFIIAFSYVLHLFFRAWHFLWHGPALWRMRREIGRIKAGQELMKKGLIAIASGDATEAGRLAVAARKSAANGVTAQWLQAQAAQMAGDTRAANDIFRALADNEETMVLGIRGLVMDARRRSDWAAVDQLLGELHRAKPLTPWLSMFRMESAARRRQWGEAEAALSSAVSAKMLNSEKGKRARAALRIAASRAAAASGDKNAAVQAAEQAVKLMPEWAPATINLAETLAAAGHSRAALRAVERGWKTHPHPQLARIALRMADTPLEAFKSMGRLSRSNEMAVESRMALAEAALAADVWGEARRYLMACINDRSATQGAYKMLARLERLERHDERAATQWLSRSLEAAPDPVWLCRACGGAHETWQPICTHCGSFDALDWQSAGKSRGMASLLEKESLNGY